MEKEAWKERVLDSLEGIQKAIPRQGLLADIERQIATPTIIPIYQWRLAAAAALILLIVNLWTIQQIVTNSTPNSQEITISKAETLPLISNYKLYE